MDYMICGVACSTHQAKDFADGDNFWDLVYEKDGTKLYGMFLAQHIKLKILPMALTAWGLCVRKMD